MSRTDSHRRPPPTNSIDPTSTSAPAWDPRSELFEQTWAMPSSAVDGDTSSVQQKSIASDCDPRTAPTETSGAQVRYFAVPRPLPPLDYVVDEDSHNDTLRSIGRSTRRWFLKHWNGQKGTNQTIQTDRAAQQESNRTKQTERRDTKATSLSTTKSARFGLPWRGRSRRKGDTRDPTQDPRDTDVATTTTTTTAATRHRRPASTTTESECPEAEVTFAQTPRSRLQKKPPTVTSQHTSQPPETKPESVPVLTARTASQGENTSIGVAPSAFKQSAQVGLYLLAATVLAGSVAGASRAMWDTCFSSVLSTDGN